MSAFLRAKKSALHVKERASQLTAGLDPFFYKPALVHFQNITNRLDRAVRIRGLWLHVGHVDDGAIVGNEGGRQGKQSVFHPEALLTRFLKHKDHAFMLRHILAEHQADLALL